MKDIAARDGVRFRFGETALGFGLALGRIECLRTDAGELRGDAYVIAGGVDSLALLRPLGIRLPLMAVKGYSATAAITALEHAPMTSVMDETYKVAITRMGNRLRIAGTAEIGTSGMKLRDNALSTLIKVASDWFPAAASYRKAQFWVGARPMLPDGPPVLGAEPDPQPVPEHRTRLHRLGHGVRLGQGAGRRHRRPHAGDRSRRIDDRQIRPAARCLTCLHGNAALHRRRTARDRTGRAARVFRPAN